MAVATNFEIFAGDDKVLGITIVNDAGESIPLDDITDISFVLKETQSSVVPILTKVLGGDISVTDAPGGEYEVTFFAADTEDLAGAYYWESVVTDVANGDYTAAYGYIAVRGKVSSRGAYCTLEEALALIADVQITKNTTPSLATAQIIIETIARDIDGVLMGRGYKLPVESAQALAFLKTTNQYGSCAAIIKSKKPVDTGMASDRGASGYYENKYLQKLAQLASPTFSLLGDDDADAETGFGASWLDLAGSDIATVPFWTRDTEF